MTAQCCLSVLLPISLLRCSSGSGRMYCTAGYVDVSQGELAGERHTVLGDQHWSVELVVVACVPEGEGRIWSPERLILLWWLLLQLDLDIPTSSFPAVRSLVPVWLMCVASCMLNVFGRQSFRDGLYLGIFHSNHWVGQFLDYFGHTNVFLCLSLALSVKYMPSCFWSLITAVWFWSRDPTVPGWCCFGVCPMWRVAQHWYDGWQTFPQCMKVPLELNMSACSEGREQWAHLAWLFGIVVRVQV